MDRLVLLSLTILIFSCGTNSTRGTEPLVIVDSAVADPANEVERTRQSYTDTIILHEDKINSIQLPFEKKEMLTHLKNAFNELSVAKEIGEQDGPDFSLYSLNDNGSELCFFGMDWEDTLKLNEIYVKQPIIKDQYGLKVGDSYQKIKKVRGTDVKTFTNYHQHTYAYFETSHIMYEISGDVFLPDTVDHENLKFTEDQMKDWTIEYVIWKQ
jgi:hypothetical protein